VEERKDSPEEKLLRQEGREESRKILIKNWGDKSLRYLSAGKGKKREALLAPIRVLFI